METRALSSREKKRLGKFLSAPSTSLLAAAAGVLCGLLMPEAAKFFSLFGVIYLNYLKLLSTPFLVSVLIVSVAQLVKQSQLGETVVSLKKMLLILAISVLGVSCFTYCSATVAYKVLPVRVSMESLDALLTDEKKSNKELGIRLEDPDPGSVQQVQRFSIKEFIQKNLPDNFYASMEHGNILQILICSLLIGIALGKINSKGAHKAIDLLSSANKTVSVLIRWSIYAVPFGVFSLLSNSMSKMDKSILASLAWNLFLNYCLLLICIVVFFLLWCRTSHCSILKMLKLQTKVFLMALGGCSTVILLPMELELMSEKLHYDREQLNLVLPFYYSLAKLANIVPLVHTAVFVALIYKMQVSLPLAAVVILVAPVLAINKSKDVSMMALLGIMMLPGELGSVVIISIGQMITSLTTLLSLLAFCSLSAMTLKTKSLSETVYINNKYPCKEGIC